MNDAKPLALIIGMTGGIGSAAGRALAAQGFRLRALQRGSAPRIEAGIEWVKGDAMNAADVAAAARGAQVIVHGANPAGYRNWRGLAIPMLANTIAAARQTGATILFPGNVYNFGADAGAALTEQSAQNPQTRKGAIRVEMEQMLRDASQTGARVVIVRAGDFFGPGARGSWFSQGLVKPGKAVRRVTYPGLPDVGHAWAYLPDVAETMARLAVRRAEFSAFEMFHFGGHWLPRGGAMADAICDAAGIDRSRVGAFPWWAIYALSPFVETLREMKEMRYLWQRPVALDNRKLVAVLGSEPHTPLPEAVRETLRVLGCFTSQRGMMNSFAG